MWLQEEEKVPEPPPEEEDMFASSGDWDFSPSVQEETKPSKVCLPTRSSSFEHCGAGGAAFISSHLQHYAPQIPGCEVSMLQLSQHAMTTYVALQTRCKRSTGV